MGCWLWIALIRDVIDGVDAVSFEDILPEDNDLSPYSLRAFSLGLLLHCVYQDVNSLKTAFIWR